jgi:hypothetical protein
MSDKFWDLSYACKVTDGADELTLKKSHGSDWSHIEMQVNDLQPILITIRSREQLEALGFMIGQLLERAPQETSATKGEARP